VEELIGNVVIRTDTNCISCKKAQVLHQKQATLSRLKALPRVVLQPHKQTRKTVAISFAAVFFFY